MTLNSISTNKQSNIIEILILATIGLICGVIQAIKENIDYSWDATTRLKQLKPARFNWIADDTNTLLEGFLAHEVSTVVPNAVTGEKDAMADPILYEDGDELPSGKKVGDVKKESAPAYQGIDHSKLVPLLVKTIQELEARIKTLEDA